MPETDLPTMRLSGPPAPHVLPPQFDRSYAHLGIVAQRGRLIEVRAPVIEGGGDWPRIHLDAEAAERLLEWLPQALAYALGESDG